MTNEEALDKAITCVKDCRKPANRMWPDETYEAVITALQELREAVGIADIVATSEER